MRPRTADYEMKPMLGDETKEEIPGASFAALRLDGRLALVRGLLRPSSELSGAGSRGADRLVGRKVERDAAEPRQRGRGWDRERRSRSESPSDQVRTTRRDGL